MKLKGKDRKMKESKVINLKKTKRRLNRDNITPKEKTDQSSLHTPTKRRDYHGKIHPTIRRNYHGKLPQKKTGLSRQDTPK